MTTRPILEHPLRFRRAIAEMCLKVAQLYEKMTQWPAALEDKSRQAARVSSEAMQLHESQTSQQARQRQR